MARERALGDWVSVGIFVVVLFLVFVVLVVPRFAGPILVLSVIFLVVVVFFAVTFLWMSGPAQRRRMPLKEDLGRCGKNCYKL